MSTARRLDALASHPQYAQHVRPVFDTLPEGLRGTFHVKRPTRLDAPVLVSSFTDLSAARRARAPAVAYMEHGCGQSYAGDPRSARHPAYAGGDGRNGVGIILAPNAVAAARWAGRYPSIPVHVIGATRVLSPPEDPRLPLLVVSFHWPGSIPEQRNALSHYRDQLGRLASVVPLAGHAHPRYADTARRVFARAGVPFIEDIEEVARRATVYAVDNSSTLWELGLTRPVIALNAPWYRRRVEHGLRFWSHVPLAVDGPDDLIAVARRLMRDGEAPEARERRESMCRDVIPHLDGATRAATLLASWALHPDCV